MKKRYLKWDKLKRKPHFYKGQKVIITSNTCGHGFKIGAVVTLTSVIFKEWWDLSAKGQGTAAIYFHEGNCKPYTGGKK